MLIINYGGGTNSTALLTEAVRRGIFPDVILFADTGSERPETYAYLDVMQDYLARVHFPPIQVLRWIRSQAPHTGEFIALHDWCEAGETLPSKAFGLSGCTTKWKQQPLDKHVRTLPSAQATWARGDKVTRWIGYDADEPERATRMFEKNPEPEKYTWRAPLVEWDMGRVECVESIRAAGLPQPGKSSCWMCPSMTAAEVRRLGVDHPQLLARALRMESAAVRAGKIGGSGKGTRKGLGGRMNWTEMLAGSAEQAPSEDVACGCYDGE